MRTTSTTDLASQLRLGITRTARRLRQESGMGLSPSQRAALATVDRFGPLTPTELADREAVKKPTITRVVARLEEEALVTRADDPGDRRSCLVSITPEGHALLEADRARKDSFLARRLEGLDAEDRATLERAAELLEELLKDERA